MNGSDAAASQESYGGFLLYQGQNRWHFSLMGPSFGSACGPLYDLDLDVPFEQARSALVTQLNDLPVLSYLDWEAKDPGRWYAELDEIAASQIRAWLD